jgi:membrane fusion protein (multidrug efflux system)
MSGYRYMLLGFALLLAFAGIPACARNSAGASETAADPQPEVSVTVAPIVRTTLHGYVTGWGRIAPEPATDGRPPANASIASAVAGLVSAIHCTEGERVRQGATLFQLDSRIADVAVDRAQQAVKFAEELVQRQERLGPGQATSQKAYQEAKQQLTAAQSELNTAQVQRRLLDVHAPIDGTVAVINAKLGQSIDSSTVLAELVDLNRLVVNAAVRSVDARQVKRGQRVDISAGTTPGASPADAAAASAVSAVAYVGPQVDSATDTVLVRARVPPRSGLRPGQFVNLRVLTDERREQLAVPVESVLQGPDGPEVALVQGDMAVRMRVSTGLREGGLMQVQGTGIRDGMSVVVRGAYGLLPKTKIKVSGQ